MRTLFAILVSSVICISIFFGMHLMTNSSNANIKKESKTQHLVYLREKKDTNIERKKRVKPKEPPKRTPPKKIKIVKTDIKNKVNQKVKIKPFKTVMKNIDVSAISSLNGAQIDMAGTLFDANSLQALKKVNPRFPRRAKLKRIKKGFVQLQFTISTSGEVSNVRIVDSFPKNIFEKSSINAIERWRFKNSNEAREATIKFNYRLQS